MRRCLLKCILIGVFIGGVGLHSIYSVASEEGASPKILSDQPRQQDKQFDSSIDSLASEPVTSTKMLPNHLEQQTEGSNPSLMKPTSPPLSLQDTGLGTQEQSLLSTCLVPPSSEPYRFRKYKPKSSYHNSQYGQSEQVDKLLKGMTNGFVVESGALDGESHSNSVFFEVHRRWNCLLVEANPALQHRIVSLNRRCHLLRGGLSLTKNVSSFKFILAQAVGGIVDTMAKKTLDGIQAKIKSGTMNGEASSGKVVDVPCFPLHHVVRALGRNVVDYWSLDTEGSEVKILQATDFDEIEVGIMTVEHQGSVNRRKAIYNILVGKGFIRAKAGMPDDLYVNQKYCTKRHIRIPDAITLR